VHGGAGGQGGSLGGAGGNISKLTFTANRYAESLRAGAGGSAIAGTGGSGGSVTDTKITGDIGNFVASFGIGAGKMGGLFAGTGGTGTIAGLAGSITNVSATRIAAILAANSSTTASNLTTANAVTAITGVTATKFGADLDGDTTFDFTDNPAGPHPSNGAFLLGDGDTAIDGIIIVKSPAPAFAPAPLAGSLIVVP
ncbi:MAG: hypothetical protein WCF18_12240, partial [Chthoniobacteraceae bacterium]